MTPDEFSAIFREHQPSVAKFLARRAEFAQVEDLCSEVFETAYLKRQDVAAGFELPWLYKIAGYVLANHRRKTAGRLRIFATLQVPDAAPSAEAIALADISLADAWATLPVIDRNLLALIAFEGLRVDEAAAATGLSANAASIRLHRARTKLAALLKD